MIDAAFGTALPAPPPRSAGSSRVEHAWAVRQLPHHHRDPFDRLLIAQAQLERLSVVTADPAFGDYDVAVVWD